MRYASFVCAFLLLAAGSAALAAAPAPMDLTTTAFSDGGVIPDKYTQNSTAPVSPALAWHHAPAGTVSFALVMHDVDVAQKKGNTDWLHWLAFDIPAATTSLPEGAPGKTQLSDGTVQSRNGDGNVGFLGPGADGNVYHHYLFELYALDTKLGLGPSATRAQVLQAMEGHILAKAVLEGRFHR